MSAQSEVIVPAAPMAQHRDPLDGVRQLAYAWIGIWGVAAEDLGNFYQRCVARGEQILNAKPSAAQPKSLEAVVSQSTTAATRRIRPVSIINAFGAVESYHIDLNIDRVLPTKEELDALIAQIDVLSREVDRLAGQRKQEE